MHYGNMFNCVCLSVCPVWAVTFESLDLVFSIQIHLQNIEIEFVYEGHRVIVKRV